MSKTRTTAIVNSDRPSESSKKSGGAAYFLLVLGAALTTLFASAAALGHYYSGSDVQTYEYVPASKERADAYNLQRMKDIRRGSNRSTECDRDVADFIRLPTPMIPHCLSNQDDLFLQNNTQIVPLPSDSLQSPLMISKIRKEVTVAICFLDGELTHNFFHFPHAMQSMFPCWSFFRRVQNMTKTRPIQMGFWFATQKVTKKFSLRNKKSHAWTVDFVKNLGACKLRTQVDYEWEDPKHVQYAYAHHPSSHDTMLIYRMKKKKKLLHFDGGSCDQETLRRRILGDKFLSIEEKESLPLTIGLINRNTTRQITNIAEMKERLQHEYPDAVVDVSYMEGMSFQEQAEYWARHNVVIAGHGAAMTNVIFMSSAKPSLLVEIFPPKLDNPFYSKLANHSGISREEWRTPVAMDDHVLALIDTDALEGRNQVRALNLTPNIDEIVALVRKHIS